MKTKQKMNKVKKKRVETVGIDIDTNVVVVYMIVERHSSFKYITTFCVICWMLLLYSALLHAAAHVVEMERERKAIGKRQRSAGENGRNFALAYFLIHRIVYITVEIIILQRSENKFRAAKSWTGIVRRPLFSAILLFSVRKVIVNVNWIDERKKESKKDKFKVNVKTM